ncbi:hypothetical protein IT157_05225 [bacterium]|nr:hypothetical protein [bacterium]
MWRMLFTVLAVVIAVRFLLNAFNKPRKAKEPKVGGTPSRRSDAERGDIQDVDFKEIKE